MLFGGTEREINWEWANECAEEWPCNLLGYMTPATFRVQLVTARTLSLSLIP
jgi:hypothetical protein